MKMRSPKHKYRVEMTYGKPIEGIGSVSSFNTPIMDESDSVIAHHIAQAKKNKTSLQIVWKENKSTYPDFNWVEIKRSNHHFNDL